MQRSVHAGPSPTPVPPEQGRRTNALASASAEFRLVVACSWLAPETFEALQEKAVVEALQAGIDWDAFLALVDRHRVPALAYSVLRKFADQSLPESVRAALKARSDSSRMQALRHSAELLELCRAFEDPAIPVIPFKGSVLSERLYGDGALRQSKDLDVLVRPEDLDRAEGILLGLGWQRKFPARELSPRQRRFVLSVSPELEFFRPGRETQADLHWALHFGSPQLLSEIWEHAVTVKWMGSHYLEPTAEDVLSLLCTHGAMHAWFRLKWLGDVATFLASDLIQDWATLVAKAQSCGLMRIFEQSLRLVQALYGLPVAEALWDAFQDEPGSRRVLNEAWIAIQRPEGSPQGIGFGFQNLFRTWRYLRHLNPEVPLGEQIRPSLYCIADFEQFSLPDRFFWAYLPLRPVFWVIRHLRRK